MTRTVLFVLLGLGVVGCGGGGVGSEEDAQRAYLGLDKSIDKAITAGLNGYNAASNANIPAQTQKGDASGSMTITGQVDQGVSTNKSMHLMEALSSYSDDGKLTYDTGGTLPALAMNLNKIPNGTLDGTLDGTYHMTGDLEDDVTLSLSFTGQLEPVGTSTTQVERKPGTTHITGTATAGNATYNVDVTR